jgi:predicted phosphodiesterase
VRRASPRAFFAAALVATPLLLHAARADAGWVRAPYQQDLTSRGVALLFELDAPHAVTVDVTKGVSGDAPEKTIDAGRDRAFEVPVSGLEPATTYRWSVKVDDGTKVDGTLTTAPEDDRPISFLVYGDNRTDDAAHATVVRLMKQTPADFLVQSGDMVSEGSDPADWTQFFAIEADLLRDRCVFPTIGNHEMAVPTGDGAQRYARLFRVAAPSGSSELWYTFRWGIARFFMLDAQDDFTGDQRAWLERALTDADAEPGLVWRFAVLHQGPFSSSLHGPNLAMRMAHVPEMLKAHKVDVIFSGHDHTYERGEGEGLRYVISGGGGAPLYPQNSHQPTTERLEAVHHFLQLQLTKTSGSMTVVRDDGSTLESCTFAPGVAGWGCPTSAPAAVNATVTPANAPPSVPPRRACDCGFTLGSLEWLGPVGTLALAAVAVLRRNHRRRDEEHDDDRS